MVWFATFGGSALFFELFEDGGLAASVRQEISSGLFRMLEFLPFNEVTGPLVLLLIILFVITSANSATFVLGMFTSHGTISPKPLMRVLWGVVQVMVAGVLLLSGGLEALQTISIVAALPFMILMIFMAASLLQSLRGEKRTAEFHEALQRSRMERMLEEYEDAKANAAPDPWSAPIEQPKDYVDHTL